MTRVAAILLAAGRSSRFGEDSKLMADLDGRALAEWAAVPLERAGFKPLVAVLQPGGEALSITLGALAFELVENPRFAEGMGTSIAAGAARLLDADVSGAVIALADMPFVRPETYHAMLAAFEASGGAAIVAARHGDRRGAPTLFPKALLAELAALDGDEGARAVVAAHRDLVVEVACAPGELDDVDTPETLEAARARLGGGR